MRADTPARNATRVHTEKHLVYGDSWKRRGEQISIQANIARKIDRLGRAGAGDTELDTRMDLLVYLVKYMIWLWENGYPLPRVFGDQISRDLEQKFSGYVRLQPEPLPSDRPVFVEAALDTIEVYHAPDPSATDEMLIADANAAFEMVLQYPPEKVNQLGRLLERAQTLYHREWYRNHRSTLIWDTSRETGE